MNRDINILLVKDTTVLIEQMKNRLKGILPDFEIELKAKYASEILKLKAEKNAIILGHNYMEPALYHSIPDHVGDSLYLSTIASKTEADIIVFCGVWFMGETAKILNQTRIVLVPSKEAGCSLAEGIKRNDLIELKQKFPDVPVVSYVNTYADTKAESDYCCTSGNAVKVLTHIFKQGNKAVIFVPDEYLAKNTATDLGADFYFPDEITMDKIEKSSNPVVIGWKARCEVHELFKPEDVDRVHQQYPGIKILAHPECPPEVIRKVDYTGSTQGMIEYVKKHPREKVALFTECAMGDNIQAEFPELELIKACPLRCKHMNLITLEQTLEALQKIQYKVEVSPEIIEKAKIPIQRMIEIQ
ncbi:MAG TPA: quinolinate synthase NadA [Candidatus Hydrogenedens sp.]|nr:quinolinate synthase NadA [Candidatus Hydrogenedens sp.]